MEHRKISAFGGNVCSPFLWSAVFFPVSFHLGWCGFLLYISESCGDEESGCSFSVWVTSSLPWQADERTVQMLGLLPWAPWGHTYKPATRALTTGTALQMSLFKWHPFSHSRTHMHTLSDIHTCTHAHTCTLSQTHIHTTHKNTFRPVFVCVFCTLWRFKRAALSEADCPLQG